MNHNILTCNDNKQCIIQRPHRHQSETPELDSSLESHVPSIPSHRPQKAETENPQVPELPKSRPRRTQTSEPASDVHSSDSQSVSEITAPVLPKHRPSNTNAEDISESEATHPIVPARHAESQSHESSEETTLPHIPLSRPRPVASSHQIEMTECKEKVEISQEREKNGGTEKNYEDDGEIIQTLSHKSDSEDDKEGLNDTSNKQSSISSGGAKDEENRNDSGEFTTEIEPREVDLKQQEKQQPVITESETSKKEKCSLNVEDDTALQEKGESKASDVAELENKPDSGGKKFHNDNDEPQSNTKSVESLPVKTEESENDKSLADHKIPESLVAEGNAPKKSSYPDTKDTLAELDSLEQEIQLTSEKLSSIPTESAEINNLSPASDAKEEKSLAEKDSVENEQKEEKKEEATDEEIKKGEISHALPAIPKSRPKPKMSDGPNMPPKIPAKRPSVASADSSSSNSSESTAAQTVHKKPPPRVPKKPSSRIAQFQEMLEQQQKADLGLLNHATPKPRPKVPARTHTVNSQDGDESKEIGGDEESVSGAAVTSVDAPKVDRVNSKFAQSLNGMIGMGLPGMAFGGNPFAAIKAAKEHTSTDSSPADEAKNAEKSKVKDVRRGRARGPRGRKLPDAVTKAVEVSDATLGNNFTIVVKNLWSFNLNEPLQTATAPILDVHETVQEEEPVAENKEAAAPTGTPTELVEVATAEVEENEDVPEEQEESVVETPNTHEAHTKQHVVEEPAHDVTASTTENSTFATASGSGSDPVIASIALEKGEFEEDGGDQMPKTTFNFDEDVDEDDEPSATATTATSIGCILNPAESSLEPEETSASDLSDS